MTHNPEDRLLDQYVSHTVESSTRTRRVLIIMITASILGFTAFWNSRSGSWINSRIALSQYAYKYWDECQGTFRDALLAQYWETCAAPRGPNRWHSQRSICEIESAQRWADLCHRISSYKMLRKFHSRAEVGKRTEKLEALRDDHVTVVHIPFFGVDFDVNDLGILGGATFVILLLWFRFSLYQELRNLDITFRLAEYLDKTQRKTLLRYTYQNLSMGQVLATPPKLPVIPRRQRAQLFWDNISKSLYILPALVQLIICAYDYRTYNIAKMIAPGSAFRIMLVSFVLFVIALLLTVNCIQLSIRTSQLWRDKSEEILKTQPAEAPTQADSGGIQAS